MIDKNSPNFYAYRKEAEALFAEYDKKIEARRPPEGYRGWDGWDTADLCRERSQKLKQLQEKYGFGKEAQGELPESNN